MNGLDVFVVVAAPVSLLMTYAVFKTKYQDTKRVVLALQIILLIAQVTAFVVRHT